VDLDAFRWLLTEPGQSLLTRATHLYVDHAGDPVRTATALRQHGDVEAAHAAAALTQVDLRARAVRKVGEDATRMYFTPEGLEQATRARVATHRAARVAFAEPSSVLDLGCGIGGDLVALARAGLTVAGIDRDELRVEVARANLDVLGLGGAVQVAAAEDVDVSGFGKLQRFDLRRNTSKQLADFYAFELANNPDAVIGEAAVDTDVTDVAKYYGAVVALRSASLAVTNTVAGSP